MPATRRSNAPSRGLAMAVLGTASLLGSACGDLDQSDFVKKRLEEDGYASVQVTKVTGQAGAYTFKAERFNTGRNARPNVPAIQSCTGDVAFKGSGSEYEMVVIPTCKGP